MSGATQDELKWAYFITNEELLKRAREHGSKSTANLEMIRDQIFLYLEECTVPTTRPELLKSLERRVEKYLRPNNKYISLTEIARRFDSVKPNYVIQSWLRGRNTIEFLGEWERQNNSRFDETAFAQLKVNCKSPAYTLTPIKWIDTVNAIGISSKRGKGGGTMAHPHIACDFEAWNDMELRYKIFKEFTEQKANIKEEG